MSAITQKFLELQKKKQLGLMTHVVCGFPNQASTVALVQTMEQTGADFIELQIPFSDPSADGPTMLEANTVALRNQTTVRDCFHIAQVLQATCSVPLIFMTYSNIVFNYGISQFIQDAHRVGIAGLIVPDFPLEEVNPYLQLCQKNNLDWIFVISPTTTEERLAQIAGKARGFLYCTSRTGVTGSKETLPQDIKNYLHRVRHYSLLPRAVGFGIAKPEHVRALKNQAECAIVGSAVVDILRKTKGLTKQKAAVKQCITLLKRG